MLRSSEQQKRSFVANISYYVLLPIRRMSRSEVESATINRIFTSKHVADLQLIMASAILFALLALVIAAPLSLFYEHALAAASVPRAPTLPLGDRLIIAFKDFLTVFGPILAAAGAIIAWAYQAGSARLGVVDLFACEISTLCRVTTVVDAVRRKVWQFEQGAGADGGGPDHIPVNGHAFTSQESYFPVFETNAHDLQALEAKVVIHITAFYTYMKSVRDYGRSLAAAAPSDQDRKAYVLGQTQIGPWRDALRTMIYMLYLGLESGRKAIGHLVEFEPEEAERTLVILISELEAYRFLREQYADPRDVHHQRISLRERDYSRIIPVMVDQVYESYAAAERGRAENPRNLMRWEAAERLIPELWARFEAAVPIPAKAPAAPGDSVAVCQAAARQAAESARERMEREPV